MTLLISLHVWSLFITKYRNRKKSFDLVFTRQVNLRFVPEICVENKSKCVVYLRILHRHFSMPVPLSHDVAFKYSKRKKLTYNCDTFSLINLVKALINIFLMFYQTAPFIVSLPLISAVLRVKAMISGK